MQLIWIKRTLSIAVLFSMLWTNSGCFFLLPALAAGAGAYGGHYVTKNYEFNVREKNAGGGGGSATRCEQGGQRKVQRAYTDENGDRQIQEEYVPCTSPSSGSMGGLFSNIPKEHLIFVAGAFQLRKDGAENLLDVFQALYDGNEAYLTGLNITEEDATNLLNAGQMSAQGVAVLARHFRTSPAHTNKLITEFNTQFNNDRIDINSIYWQSCMKSGRGSWYTVGTDQVQRLCMYRNQKGCSPATGAAYCYPNRSNTIEM